MPIITCNLARLQVNWTLSATPLEAFVTSAGAFIDTAPYVTNIVSGTTATIDIPASQAANVSYLFEAYQGISIDDFYLQDGTLYATTNTASPLANRPKWQWLSGAGFNSQWYTGNQVGANAPTADNKQLAKVTRTGKRNLIDPIQAMMPLVDEDLKNLANTSVTSYLLDSGARRISELMLGDSVLRALLPRGISYRGQYVAATTYNQQDAVSFNGEVWVMVDASPQAAIAPGTNPLIWDKAVQKGSPGGTGADVVGFNANTWAAQNLAFKEQATARGDALALFNAIAQPDLSGYALQSFVNSQISNNNTAQQTANDSKYGRLGFIGTYTARQTFNGGLGTLDRPPGDNGFDGANTRFVQQALATFAPSRLAMPVGWGRISATAATPAGTNTAATIVYGSRPFSVGNIVNTVGDISIPEDGNYLFLYSFAFRIFSNFNGTANRIRLRAFLNRFTGAPTGNTGELLRVEQGTLTGGGNIEHQGSAIRLMDCLAGQQYNTQFSLNGADADGAGASSNATALNSIQRNQVMIWRVG